MSSFVDSTLFRFGQDAFVSEMLTHGLGLETVFNMSFALADFELESVALSAIFGRSYKVPVFETVRTDGTEEQILPDSKRVRTQRTSYRFGRLDWIDVTFKATLLTRMKMLVAPLQSATVEMLHDRLGEVSSLAILRSKLEVLYAPSVVDALFARLKISTLTDFERRQHLFIELVGAEPPAFEAADPSTARDYDIVVCVKISEAFDVAGALQAAKLCRDILEHESVPDETEGVERSTRHTFVTLFPNEAVTDTTIPGHSAAETKDAVSRLFTTERMFAHFID